MIRNDQTASVKKLITTEPSLVNKPLRGGWMPLVLAARLGHWSIAKFLREHGAHGYTSPEAEAKDIAIGRTRTPVKHGVVLQSRTSTPRSSKSITPHTSPLSYISFDLPSSPTSIGSLPSNISFGPVYSSPRSKAPRQLFTPLSDISFDLTAAAATTSPSSTRSLHSSPPFSNTPFKHLSPGFIDADSPLLRKSLSRSSATIKIKTPSPIKTKPKTPSPIKTKPKTPSPPRAAATVAVMESPVRYATIKGYGDLKFKRDPTTPREQGLFEFDFHVGSTGWGPHNQHELIQTVKERTPVFALKNLIFLSIRKAVKPKSIYVQAKNGRVEFVFDEKTHKYKRVEDKIKNTWKVQKEQILHNLETQTNSGAPPGKYAPNKSAFALNKIVIISERVGGNSYSAKYGVIVGFTPTGWLRVCDLPMRRVAQSGGQLEDYWEDVVDVEAIRNAKKANDVLGYEETVRWNEDAEMFTPSQTGFKGSMMGRSIDLYDHERNAVLKGHRIMS
jgi:hypothetical protein